MQEFIEEDDEVGTAKEDDVESDGTLKTVNIDDVEGGK